MLTFASVKVGKKNPVYTICGLFLALLKYLHPPLAPELRITLLPLLHSRLLDYSLLLNLLIFQKVKTATHSCLSYYHPIDQTKCC